MLHFGEVVSAESYNSDLFYLRTGPENIDNPIYSLIYWLVALKLQRSYTTESHKMWHFCMPRLLNLYITVSQLGCFWHFRLDNSLSWGTDYPVYCRISSTIFDSCPLDASSIPFPWSHDKSDCDKPDVAKCLLGEGGQFFPWLRTTALDYLNYFLFQLTFTRHFLC